MSALTKKRKRNPEQWKQNVRKTLREKGLPFVDKKGNERPGKSVGPECGATCHLLCSKNISAEKRQELHEHFWNLSVKEKHVFYGHFVKKSIVKRRTIKCNKANNYRRKASFKYYLKPDDRTIQVCKKYFLNTLAISQTTISYFFAKTYEKDTQQSTYRRSNIGKKNSLSQEKNQEIINHISSFPSVDSHYSRPSSSRKYLDPILKVTKIYNLYETDVDHPVGIDSVDSYCRLCLQKLNNNTSFDIFPDKLAGSQENVIPIRLAAVAAIEVSKCDGLPQRICQSCRYLLELSYAFRKKSQISDGKLRRHLKLLSQGKTVKYAPLFEDDEDQDQEMCEDSLEFLRTCDRQRDEELRQQIRNEVEAENRELYESIKIELRKAVESELRSEIEKQVKIDFEKRIFRQKLKKMRMEESKAILNDLEEFLRMKIFERNDVDELTNNLNEEAEKEDKEIKTKSSRTENLLNKNAHKQIVNDQLTNRPIDQQTEKISCTNVMTYQIRMKSNVELNTNVETAADDNLDNVAVISSNEIVDDVVDDEMSRDQDDNLEILKVFDYESGEDFENTKEFEKCEKTEDDVQIIEADSIIKSPVLSFYCADPLTHKSSVGRSTATPKIFKCTMCPIQVSTQYSLERHLRVHLKGNNKSVTCPECKIVFSCSSTLKRHMVIHSSKRPYVCGRDANFRGFSEPGIFGI